MLKITRQFFYAAILLPLVTQFGIVQADDDVTFAMEFQKQEIPLDLGSTLNASKAGFRYGEVNYLPMRLDFAFGRLMVEHEGDPITLGVKPVGHYAGLAMSWSSSAERFFQMGADLSYTYYSAKGDMSNLDELEVSWRQSEGKLWYSLRLSQRLRVYGCNTAINIKDADQTVIGATPSYTVFEHQERYGQCGGLQIDMGNGGLIGMEGYGRNQRGGLIYFSVNYER